MFEEVVKLPLALVWHPPEYVVHKLKFGSHCEPIQIIIQSGEVIKARVQVLSCITVVQGFQKREMLKWVRVTVIAFCLPPLFQHRHLCVRCVVESVVGLLVHCVYCMCGCVQLVRFSCSPTSTDEIHTIKLVLHKVQGMFTRCTPNANIKGTKLCNILLERNSLTICCTHYLHMSFIICGSYD